ncbi:hypothetical protein GC176_05280 [bacterium]|nr:hypothetical protein [bacterium]
MNRSAVWCLLLVLVALHHDFWFWNDPSLVAGWLPVGLAWHIGLSMAAVLFWALAVKFAWPDNLDAGASSTEASEVTE